MNNLEFYNKARAVPAEAKKTIGAGRLKGMTDVNPMWRIKALTDMFGPVGKGWKPEIVKTELLESPETKEITASVEIKLYVKYDGFDGPWSDPIPGVGGAPFVVKETSGLHMSDECFKSAYTDALSVACKAIGIAADVYYEKDRTKYSASEDAPAKAPEPPKKPKYDTTAPEWTATRSNPEKPKKETEKTDAEIRAIRLRLNKKAKEIMSVTGFDATKVNEILCDKCSINKPATKADYEQLLIAAGVMLGEFYDRKD